MPKERQTLAGGAVRWFALHQHASAQNSAPRHFADIRSFRRWWHSTSDKLKQTTPGGFGWHCVEDVRSARIPSGWRAYPPLPERCWTLPSCCVATRDTMPLPCTTARCGINDCCRRGAQSLLRVVAQVKALVSCTATTRSGIACPRS